MFGRSFPPSIAQSTLSAYLAGGWRPLGMKCCLTAGSIFKISRQNTVHFFFFYEKPQQQYREEMPFESECASL